jgi:hypothetical protein
MEPNRRYHRERDPGTGQYRAASRPRQEPRGGWPDPWPPPRGDAGPRELAAAAGALGGAPGGVPLADAAGVPGGAPGGVPLEAESALPGSAQATEGFATPQQSRSEGDSQAAREAVELRAQLHGLTLDRDEARLQAEAAQRTNAAQQVEALRQTRVADGRAQEQAHALEDMHYHLQQLSEQLVTAHAERDAAEAAQVQLQQDVNEAYAAQDAEELDDTPGALRTGQPLPEPAELSAAGRPDPRPLSDPASRESGAEARPVLPPQAYHPMPQPSQPPRHRTPPPGGSSGPPGSSNDAKGKSLELVEPVEPVRDAGTAGKGPGTVEPIAGRRDGASWSEVVAPIAGRHDATLSPAIEGEVEPIAGRQTGETPGIVAKGKSSGGKGTVEPVRDAVTGPKES